MRHVHADSHLHWVASARGGEAGDGGNGRGNAPELASRRAPAASGDGGERWATCEGVRVGSEGVHGYQVTALMARCESATAACTSTGTR